LSGPSRLDGQTAVVTGAAGGIGRAVVAALCEAGAGVIATDIIPDGGKFPAKASYRRCDVTDRKAIEALIDEELDARGKIDILVLCAGIVAITPLPQSTDKEWENILAVNLMDAVNPVRKLYPVMAERAFGKIVAIGSISAKIGGIASGPAYVASKSAVHGLMKWVAKNTIAPGPVVTPMVATIAERAGPSAKGNIPLGRLGLLPRWRTSGSFGMQSSAGRQPVQLHF